jgi:coagulation factor V (labile factor)
MILACLWCAAGACSKDESKDYRGLPPAESWQAPSPASSSASGAAATQGGMGNPHAGMGMNDPHAGLDMNNPHAGMGMNDPHAGLDMNNPHAGMDMNDPHAGMDMGDGGVDVTQLGLQPPDPDRAIDASKFLKGTIKPSAETKARIAPGAVIFLSVKRADPATGQPTGAPLAVQRVSLSAWPLWFELTEADAMVSGTAFDGDVVITAWSDQDQDAISKQPGDVQGQVRAKIPAKDLVLVLDKVVP